jgi:hypothetical protein
MMPAARLSQARSPAAPDGYDLLFSKPKPIGQSRRRPISLREPA